jgi:acetolactate synthase small subunit
MECEHLNQAEEDEMNFQHVENILIRFRGQSVDIKTMSGGVYEGTITDVTNDYVTLKVHGAEGDTEDQVIVLLHSIESILPRGNS